MSKRTRNLALCTLTALAFVTLGRAPRLVQVSARDLRPPSALVEAEV